MNTLTCYSVYVTPHLLSRIWCIIFSDRILEHYVITYLEDIIIFFKTLEKHKLNLEVVLRKIKAYNLTLNKNKRKLLRTKIRILDSIVSHKKVKPDPNKKSAIKI